MKVFSTCPYCGSVYIYDPKTMDYEYKDKSGVTVPGSCNHLKFVSWDDLGDTITRVCYQISDSTSGDTKPYLEA